MFSQHSLESMDVNKQPTLSMEKATPNMKVPKTAEEDCRIKEILNNTRKVLEMEERNNQISPKERKILDIFKVWLKGNIK